MVNDSPTMGVLCLSKEVRSMRLHGYKGLRRDIIIVIILSIMLYLINHIRS
jgi:hypothetical protein